MAKRRKTVGPNTTTPLEDLKAACREAVAFQKGQTRARVHVPEDLSVGEVRRSLGLSQKNFARLFGIELATIRNWEQGRSAPYGPARALLQVIRHNPKSVIDALWSPEQQPIAGMSRRRKAGGSP